ncbi:MAG: flagellar hook-basal body protein [Nibricoccus sp.]
MNIGLYQSAASLSALERWQEAVAQNMTSSQVPGYRKRTVEFSGLEMGQLQTDPKSRISDGNAAAALFPSSRLGVSFQPGETTPTRRDLDLAIEGDGFFEVQMPDGSRGYTRAGHFQLNAQRTVVTNDNMPVLTEGGTPIVLQPENGALAISMDGAITQGDTQLGRVSVVRFADNQKLVPLGNGVFVAGDELSAERVERPVVLQGYTEASNVSPLHEMISLVQIARAYEANQKVITSRDQNFQKALDALG